MERFNEEFKMIDVRMKLGKKERVKGEKKEGDEDIGFVEG